MKLLLAYYGDDFTGSTDVMEALQWAGPRTVLFLAPPTGEQLARFENLRAFGVAGWSRTMSVDEMETELRPVFEGLRESGAPIVHYKICSTFDSSPEVGNIGKALELGREVFGNHPVPVLVGAPVLGRYTVFGNLYARSGLDTEPYRLDRHPTMRQHPITPMDEADLRRVLQGQSRLSTALFDVLRLEDENPEARLDELLSLNPAALVFDVLRPAHLATIGPLIERMQPASAPLFAIGSSGMEYALTAGWEKSGRIASLRSHQGGRPEFAAVEQLLVMTGSCSPVNERQIDWALRNGFVGLALNPARLIDPETSEAEIAETIRKGLELAGKGASVILHSSRGPEDPRVTSTLAQYRKMGFSDLDLKLKNGRTLGPKLGRILKGMLEGRHFARAVVAGGDTSGYVARELGIVALEAIAPVAPGSPLCRMHAPGALDGMEIIFKGGQVGLKEIYETILKGTN